jgi:hypothetical protein
MLVLGPKGVKTVQDDELDVIIGFLDDKFSKGGSGGWGVSRIHSITSWDLPLTAAGFWVRVVREVAASYLTACEGELSSSKMHRIHFA